MPATFKGTNDTENTRMNGTQTPSDMHTSDGDTSWKIPDFYWGDGGVHPGDKEEKEASGEEVRKNAGLVYGACETNK